MIMNLCLDLEFLQNVKSGDLLTYLALVLAYVAYIRLVNHDLTFWKSIFISFKKDLETHRAWLINEYDRRTYNDKNSYSPAKIIFPPVLESLPEIIRRGAAEIPWVSDKFISNLSLFNERIIAFNSALDHIKQVCSADPVTSEKLKDKLNKLGLDKGSVGYSFFKRKISKLKKSDDMLYLAENIHRLHKMVHVELIGNQSNQDKLQFLYSEITKELKNIINNFDMKRPGFIRYKWLILGLSLISFVLIENIFIGK